MKRIISSAAALGLLSIWVFSAQQACGSPSFQTAKFLDGSEVDSKEIGTRIPLIFVHGVREDASVWGSFLYRFWNPQSDISSHFKPYVFEYQSWASKMQADDPAHDSGIGIALGTFVQQWRTKPTTAPDYGFNANKVVIISHSYGGLVARAMMANTFVNNNQVSLGSDYVSLLITLATPHHGTPAAGAAGTDAAKFFLDLAPGITTDMIWDCYDGNSAFGCSTGISSEADYSKIVAYGAVYSPVPPGASSDPTFDVGGAALCVLDNRYCANDGIVPIGSARFDNANGVRRRQVDTSCNHDNICNGEYNVGGIAIFDQIAADLATVVPPPPPPDTPPSVQTTQATGVTSSSATLNATISSTGSGTIVDARFEYTSGSFPGTVIDSLPVSGSTFSYNLSGLLPNTPYIYHAYAKNSVGLWNQVVNNVNFTTKPPGTFQITATAGANGTITPTDVFTVLPGATQAFTASGNAGYTPDQWLVDGASVQTGGSSYTLQNIQASHSISVTFKADTSQTHTLTLATSNPDHGVSISISPGDLNGNTGGVVPPITLKYNANTTVNLTAVNSVNGTPILKWILDGVDYKPGFFAVSVTMDADHALTAVYGFTYAVTPVAGANGTISPSTAQEIGSGGSITFTATPAVGYVVNQWFLGGSQTPVASGVNNYTVNNVANNTTVTVTFKLIPVATHTLTLNSSPSTGAIVTASPADNNGNNGGVLPQTLTYNENVSITVTAPLSVGNNRFQKWQLDGQDFSTAFSIQINSDSDHTLTAFFGPGPFAVTPVAGINGTISPDTPQLVNNGGSVTFNATGASNHYAVDTWFVNNAPVQVGGNSLTVTNVTNNTVVLVTFASPQISVVPTPTGIAITFTGTLQKAAQPDGPYTDIVGPSPQNISLSGAQGAFSEPRSKMLFQCPRRSNHVVT